MQVKATALTLDTAAKAGLRDEIIGSADMDVFTFTIPDEGLASGVFGVDVDSFPGVNTYLRLYDASWNLLASNDDGLSPSENVNKGGESFIQVAARAADAWNGWGRCAAWRPSHRL